MKTYGVGIIGYGFMGRTHTLAYKSIPFYYNPRPLDIRLRAVLRAKKELAADAVREGGFERAAESVEDLINDPAVDIVHICTPNSQHIAALRAAVAAGKHIYCDKPVTGSLAEADELAGLLAAYKGVAQVACQYRFFPATLKARQLVEQGFLGPITHFRASYLHSGSVDPNKAVNWKSTAAAGGGVIRDLGIHIIDLLWWLIGPFTSASCTSRIWSPRRPSLDRPGTMMDVDAEEAALIVLRKADGAFGSVDVSKIATGAEDELRFEIHGRHGAMRFNLMQPNVLEVYDGRLSEGGFGGQRGWQQIATMQKYLPPGGFPGPKFTLGWIRGHIHCLYSFLEAVAGGKEAHPSLAEGIRIQRVLEAVRDSAARQAWVDLPQE